MAAVSVSVPMQYFSEERQGELVPEVVACTGAISRVLGGGRFASGLTGAVSALAGDADGASGGGRRGAAGEVAE